MGGSLNEKEVELIQKMNEFGAAVEQAGESLWGWWGSRPTHHQSPSITFTIALHLWSPGTVAPFFELQIQWAAWMFSGSSAACLGES
jgi:hypothetical protein